MLGIDLSKNMIDIGKQRAQEFKDDKVMYCKNLILHFERGGPPYGEGPIWRLGVVHSCSVKSTLVQCSN